ncbi:hypothetical protein D3C86_547330 [compost metagenome]
MCHFLILNTPTISFKPLRYRQVTICDPPEYKIRDLEPRPLFETKRYIVIFFRAEMHPVALLVHVEDYFNQLSVELEDEVKKRISLGQERSHRLA